MVGCGVTPFQTDPDATLRLAQRAEELGYGRFGSAEGWAQDAVVLLTRIAGVTSRIGLATAVLSVWSRTPGAIAMAAAGLQRASDGRFMLGLGANSPPLVEGLHGLTWGRPVDRMRTTLVATRALLEGERLPLAREGVRPLRLGAPPDDPIPISLAALAPDSIRLAGELADHWLPFLWARSRLAEGRELLAEGDDVEALLAANAGGGPPRLPTAAERLARDVTVMGTYDEAPGVVQSWLEAGADTVDLVLPLAVPEQQLREMLEAAAPAASS